MTKKTDQASGRTEQSGHRDRHGMPAVISCPIFDYRIDCVTRTRPQIACGLAAIFIGAFADTSTTRSTSSPSAQSNATDAPHRTAARNSRKRWPRPRPHARTQCCAGGDQADQRDVADNRPSFRRQLVSTGAVPGPAIAQCLLQALLNKKAEDVGTIKLDPPGPVVTDVLWPIDSHGADRITASAQLATPLTCKIVLRPSYLTIFAQRRPAVILV